MPTPNPTPTMPERIVAIEHPGIDHRTRLIVGDDDNATELGTATSLTFASELVRRYNTHAALVEACRCALDRVQACAGAMEEGRIEEANGDIDRAEKYLRPAIALAEGGAA